MEQKERALEFFPFLVISFQISLEEKEGWRLKAIFAFSLKCDDVGTAQLVWLRKEVEREELMHVDLPADFFEESNIKLEIIPDSTSLASAFVTAIRNFFLWPKESLYLSTYVGKVVM